MKGVDRKWVRFLKAVVGGCHARVAGLRGGWMGKGWPLLVPRRWAGISCSGVLAAEDQSG
jgi:hypothetical protein